MEITPQEHLKIIQAQKDYKSHNATIENLGTKDDITTFRYTVSFEKETRYPEQEIKFYGRPEAVFLS